MSQYPYQPPPNIPYGYGSYSQDPLSTLLAPAKRASIFMLIMAGLMIPCGLLVGMASLMDFSQFASDPAFQQVQKQFATIGWSISTFFKLMAAVIAIPGIFFLLFGITVRRGGMGSVVASIILCCLMALLAAIGVFGGVVQLSRGGGQAFIGIMFWLVVLVSLIATLVFLFQAAKNSGSVNSLRTGQHPMQQYPQYPPTYQPPNPSQQPQSFQQPPNQWGQPTWPPQPQPPQQQQNWPPPPSNPT